MFVSNYNTKADGPVGSRTQSLLLARETSYQLDHRPSIFFIYESALAGIRTQISPLEGAGVANYSTKAEIDLMGFEPTIF